MSEPVPEEHFQISTVSRLTGLTVHTIRTWEKRYNVVTPKRTDTGRRLYARDDIRRLTLLKSLVDAGHGISSICSLPTENLEQRLRESISEAPVGCRVTMAGEHLLALLESDADQLFELRVAATFPTLEELAKQPEPIPQSDLVLVEAATLFDDTVKEVLEQIDRCGARRAVLIYAFAPGNVLKSVQKAAGITAIRGPVNAEELRLACLADIQLGQPQPSGPAFDAEPPAERVDVPERKFSPQQLAKLSKISSKIQCECPRHLSNLLFGLTAFESYSSECESRNAEDQEVHRFLSETTGRARAMMEESLERVLEHEGIEI